MSAEPVDVAIISDQPTPYRLHVLNRLSRELPEARVHNLFTHRLASPSEPWVIQMGEHLRPVFWEDAHLPFGRFRSPRSRPLFEKICQYLRQHRVRLVILLGYNDLTRVMLIRWAKREGLPLLLTGDSNIFGEAGRPAWKYALKRRLIRWIVDSVAGLMPMGTAGRAFFRLYADHDKPTFLFPYEPDYESLQRRDEAAELAFCTWHGLAPGRRRLLYCGRLAAPKRVDVLIDAFVSVADRCPPWDLLLAGRGPLQADLEARVPPPLRQAGRVKFLGFLQFHETAACYHACDALVLPSQYEPWALVVNEAVACGLAVIATEVVGAAVELVRHNVNGLIVPPRDRRALAEAILELSRPGRCDAMKANAPRLLADWRAAADPVEGVRQALRHFGLIT